MKEVTDMKHIVLKYGWFIIGAIIGIVVAIITEKKKKEN